MWNTFVLKWNTHHHHPKTHNKNDADDIMDLSGESFSIKDHLFCVLTGFPGHRQHEIILYKSSLNCMESWKFCYSTVSNLRFFMK